MKAKLTVQFNMCIKSAEFLRIIKNREVQGFKLCELRSESIAYRPDDEMTYSSIAVFECDFFNPNLENFLK